MAQQINQISHQQTPINANIITYSLNIQVQQQQLMQRQLNEAGSGSGATSSSTNPFDDNFSDKLLNDNDIFGLEFDRIRYSNEATTPANSQTQQGKVKNTQVFYSRERLWLLNNGKRLFELLSGSW